MVLSTISTLSLVSSHLTNTALASSLLTMSFPFREADSAVPRTYAGGRTTAALSSRSGPLPLVNSDQQVKLDKLKDELHFS